MSNTLRAYLLLTFTALLWSGNFIVARAAHDDIGPLTLSAARWVLVCLMLLPWTIYQLRRHPLSKAQLWRVFIMALLGVTGYNTFVYIGLQYTSAPNGVLFNSTIPFWVLFAQWAILKRPLSGKDVVGLVLSLIGVAILVSQGQLSQLTDLTFSPGDIWIVMAAIGWGFYTALLPHWKPPQLDILSFLGVLSLMGVGFILVARWVDPFQEPALTYSISMWSAMTYVSICATILAWFCYIQGVHLIGAEIGGQSIHLMPVFVAILAYFFLGETLQVYHYVGAGFIVAGLIASNRLTIFQRS